MPIPIGKKSTKTSTNTYVNVFASNILTDPYLPGTFCVQYVENNANAVTLKITGSIDGVTFSDVDLDGTGTTQITVAKNSNGYATFEGSWVYLNVQVKSTVDDTHGSITVTVSQG